MVERISAAILAGGKGSRFNGFVKPKTVIGGEMIISRILSVLGCIFSEIIIVTNQPFDFAEFSSCKISGDEIPSSGPLGGIHAALKAASNEAVFVLAGDMPFPDKNIILRMIKDYENYTCQALVPRIDEYAEPLHSVYNTSLAGAIEDHLARKGAIAVIDFLKTVNVRYLEFEKSEENLKAFTNINKPEDLVLAEKRWTQKPF